MPALKYGFTLPFSDARKVAEMASEAEEAGWDGLFLGDAVWCMDPLIALTAAAMTTTRIRLGTMVIPVPLRVPWKLASESLAVEHLSEGRLTLGLGMGATWMGWQGFPDYPTDAKSRAEMLDEMIDILTGLFQARQFDYDGKHYHLKLSQVDPMHYPKPSLQQPRIPIWIPGVWGRKQSMQRVLKCDGIFPAKMDREGQFVEITPTDVCEMKTWLEANRPVSQAQPQAPFDIVVEGKTFGMTPEQMRDTVQPWAEAGATWFVESTWTEPHDKILARLHQGPPPQVG